MLKKLTMIVVVFALMVFAGCGTGPDAPTGLTVTSTAPITLSWNGVTGITNYSVYRGTASGGLTAKTLLAGNVAATTYVDTTATAGTTYYYQVTALDSSGESGGSNEVNAVAQSQSGSSFVLSGVNGGSQITLNWSDVSGAVSFNVYRSNVSAIITDKTKVASGILTTSFIDTTASSGSTYYYQVTAVNSSGIEFLVSNESAVAF